MGDEEPHGKTRRSIRSRARLDDVAALAGVGIATVDRVLNERGNVSPETARRIIEAARQLGLPRTLPVPYRRGLRLDVILVRPDTPFFERLNEAFIRVAATLDRSVIVQRSFVDEARPKEVADRIAATNGHAVIVCGAEHPAVIDAVTAVTSAGIPVVTLVSDLPTAPRLAYVGVDHYGTGRTAGFFMARFACRPSPVVVLCHSFGYRAHAERVSGFRDALTDYAPETPIARILEGRDEQMLTEQLICDALREFPEAVGIYNTGGANRAVERALKAAAGARKVVFIGHELTVHTKRMLNAGTLTLVIDQNPEQQARSAIDVLLRRFGYVEKKAEPTEVAFTIHGPENLKRLGDEDQASDPLKRN